jgi:hypothetical protein
MEENSIAEKLFGLAVKVVEFHKVCPVILHSSFSNF